MDTGNPGYFNRYAYTFNDPINLLDPDGQHPAAPVAAGIGFVILANQHRRGVQGAVAAGSVGVGLAARNGSSPGRVAVVGGKSAATGYASGFAGKRAATAVAGGLGFVDGALRSDSEGIKARLQDGAKVATFEAGTVFAAATTAEKLLGGKSHIIRPIIKGTAIAGAQLTNELNFEESGSDLPNNVDDLAEEILDIPNRLDPIPDILPDGPF